MAAPILETDRLIMRAHKLEDFDNVAALWSDPNVTRYVGGGIATREESWARLLRYIGLWPALGFGFFVVNDRETGTFLGEVGLADFHRDIVPSLDGFAEAGWVLTKAAWGRGIANEALNAVLTWYGTQEAQRPTACIMNADNYGSRRVAEKSGFVELARTAYKGAPAIMFHHKG